MISDKHIQSYTKLHCVILYIWKDIKVVYIEGSPTAVTGVTLHITVQVSLKRKNKKTCIGHTELYCGCTMQADDDDYDDYS